METRQSVQFYLNRTLCTLNTDFRSCARYWVKMYPQFQWKLQTEPQSTISVQLSFTSQDHQILSLLYLLIAENNSGYSGQVFKWKTYVLRANFYLSFLFVILKHLS